MPHAAQLHQHRNDAVGGGTTLFAAYISAQCIPMAALVGEYELEHGGRRAASNSVQRVDKVHGHEQGRVEIDAPAAGGGGSVEAGEWPCCTWRVACRECGDRLGIGKGRRAKGGSGMRRGREDFKQTGGVRAANGEQLSLGC
eukprot:scaffold1397_cov122-Isochrysis_galbana.AAC.6